MQIIKMPKKSFNKESFRISSTKLSAPVDVKYSTEEEVWSICYNSIKKTMEFSLD